MSSSSPRPGAQQRIPEKFAALLDMGFQRVEAATATATAESVRLDANTFKVTQIRPAMGSFVSISALHESSDLAEEAIGHAFGAMDSLIDLLNRFDEASAVSQLNDAGRLASAPIELIDVVQYGLRYYEVTQGAFDITVKPLIDLFRDPKSYEPIDPPAPELVREALELIGGQHVEVGGGRVRFGREGMSVTLDGIAKGYIVDKTAAVLRDRGVERFLINAGGDIRTSGNRGDQQPWTVAVRDPGDPAPSWDSAQWHSAGLAGSDDDPAAAGHGFPDIIQLDDGAVATSGSYEIYFDRDHLAHHIVSTETGASPTRSTSVTVTAPCTLTADALATAVFVLGPERGVALINGLKGCECLVIDREQAQWRSIGWRGLTQNRKV